jgi:hypothetical protein
MEVFYMRKTAILTSFLLIILVMISCMEKEGSVSAEPAPTNAKARFEKAKQEYLTMKKEGRDVSEIAPLIQPLRDAIQARDYAEADRLLTRVEKLLAGASRAGGDTTTGLSVQGTPRDISYEPIAIDPHFGYGIEYAAEGLAKVYSPLGANWAKIPLVDWGRIEPNPPRKGVHNYNWGKLDKIVSEYQRYGFKLLVVLKARCKWGSKPARAEHRDKAGYPSTPPKPEHLGDYASFVRSIVERYDNDGIDDMPGLKMAIGAYELESEAQHSLFWQGTPEEYGKVLQVTYKEAKKADPNTIIFLSGLNFADMFDDMISLGEVEQRINTLPTHQRSFAGESLSFINKALSYGDYFDMVEFHYVNDYKGVYRQVEYLKKELQRHGHTKPIWAGDATAGPAFVPNPASFNPYMPKSQAEQTFKQLENKRDAKHQQTTDWFFSEQSKNMIKKFVVGKEVGLAGIMMGNTKDWPGYSMPNFVFQGMIDQDKQPRPAFYAYQLLIEKLKGYDTIQRLKYESNVHAYRFSGGGKKPLYVAWAEKGGATIELKTNAKTIPLIQPPTLRVQKKPHVEKVSSKGGIATLHLDSVPVFIELN